MSETKVPALPSVTPNNIGEFARALKQILDVREGLIGDPLDANVTYRDLIGVGALKANLSYNGRSGFPALPPTGEPDGYIPEQDLTTPPAPTGFTATGLFASVQLQWEQPPGTYRSHAYTEVWRSNTNLLEGAVLIGTSDTRFYVDQLGTSATRYYWVRFVSKANVTGPYNAVAGTRADTATDPALVLASLSGQITASQLNSSLNSRIDLIDGIGTGSVNARIASEAYTRQTADYALGASISTVQATLQGVTFHLPLEQWVLNGQQIVTLSDGKSGTKALRLSGVAGGYPNQGNFIPINPGKKYRVKFWARPSSDAAGLLYFSLRQFTADNLSSPGPVNGGRSPYKPSGWNRAMHIAQFGDTWGEYNFLWTDADWQTGVKFFQPEFLDNYSGSAGYWDIQGLTIFDVTESELLSASIQTEALARANADGTLLAQYTVKTDVAGRVAGFGLASEGSLAGGSTSSFGIVADRFYVAAPNDYVQEGAPPFNIDGKIWFKPSTKQTFRSTGSAWEAFSPIVPFVVQATQTVVGGVTVPPGVYMNAAYIKDGTITTAKIADAAIDNAKIANLDASKITTGYLSADRIEAGTIDAKIANISAAVITSGTINTARIGDATIGFAKIANDIQSSGYVAGSAGWRIDKTGSVELNAATFRGTLDVKSSATGARMEIKNDLITIHDGTRIRVRLGNLA